MFHTYLNLPPHKKIQWFGAKELRVSPSRHGDSCEWGCWDLNQCFLDVDCRFIFCHQWRSNPVAWLVRCCSNENPQTVTLPQFLFLHVKTSFCHVGITVIEALILLPYSTLGHSHQQKNYGKRLLNHGKSASLMGNLTISMSMLKSYMTIC